MYTYKEFNHDEHEAWAVQRSADDLLEDKDEYSNAEKALICAARENAICFRDDIRLKLCMSSLGYSDKDINEYLRFRR